MRNIRRDIMLCAIVSLMIVSLVIFVVFAVRTIIDPMYRNPRVINNTKQIFFVLAMPYYVIEYYFVGTNPDGSHRFDLFWTPLSVILTALYVMIGGNILRFLCLALGFCKRKTRDDNKPDSV